MVTSLPIIFVTVSIYDIEMNVIYIGHITTQDHEPFLRDSSHASVANTDPNDYNVSIRASATQRTISNCEGCVSVRYATQEIAHRYSNCGLCVELVSLVLPHVSNALAAAHSNSKHDYKQHCDSVWTRSVTWIICCPRIQRCVRLATVWLPVSIMDTHSEQ